MTVDISHFIETLKQEVAHYRVPVVDLVAVQTRSPFKILVATILSARTKDEVTASASKRLFRLAPDVDGLDGLSREKIQELIFPVGFYKSKAKYLSKLPGALDAFGRQVPENIDDLVTLPGVGRKTANLVRAVAFDKDAICVDTHVHRIMNIWGFVKTKTPLKTEQALRKKLPGKHWKEVNGILVAFGQGTCRPVSPHCDRCVLSLLCPQKGVTPRKIKPGQRK
jgi:endonuclease-3